MSEPIKIGDIVKVEWEYMPPLTGVVEYIPQATGDSWQIHADNGDTVLVQLFCKMTRKKKTTGIEP